MANEILTRCGYRCDLCLAYRPNVKQEPTNQQILSGGWFKYFGFRISPDLIVCDGCLADNPKLIDRQCPVGPCVISRGLLHCGECEHYGCDKLQERWVVYEDIAKKTGLPIPLEDRERFIAPYESKERLDNLRNL